MVAARARRPRRAGAARRDGAVASTARTACASASPSCGWRSAWRGCGSSPRPASWSRRRSSPASMPPPPPSRPRDGGRCSAGPPPIVLAEALRLCFPFGGVPLATLAISQSAGPLVGLGRVGGVLLITWVRVAAGRADRRRRPSGRRAPVARRRRDVGTWPLVAPVRSPSSSRSPSPWSPPAATTSAARCASPWSRAAGRRARERARRARRRSFRAPPRGDPLDRRRHRLDLVMWPENVIDTAEPFADERQAAPRSPPRPPASACRSSSASPRTPAPAASPTPR